MITWVREQKKGMTMPKKEGKGSEKKVKKGERV